MHKWSAKQHWYLDFHFFVLGDRSRSLKKPLSLIFASRCSVVANSRKQRSHKKASIFSIFASRSRVVANSRTQRPHKETHATTPKQDDPQIQIIWSLGSPGGHQNASKNNNEMDVHMFTNPLLLVTPSFCFPNLNLKIGERGPCCAVAFYTKPRVPT